MEKSEVYSRTELIKHVLIKLMMKVEEKKNLVAVCYDAVLLLIIHLPHGRQMGINNTLYVAMLEVKEQRGDNDGKVIQIQTIVMKFNQCRMTYRTFHRNQEQENSAQRMHFLDKRLVWNHQTG